MSYSSASDVAALTPDLTMAASTFSASTNPTLTEVNSFLSSGCAIIEASIGSKGYGAIPLSSAARGLAAKTETFFGAYQAELSVISARVDRTENTRDERFKRAFEYHLKLLMGLDLSVMGVSRTGRAAPYAGGISQTDKDDNYDGDTVKGRFLRGQFGNSEVDEPSVKGTSAS